MFMVCICVSDTVFMVCTVYVYLTQVSSVHGVYMCI